MYGNRKYLCTEKIPLHSSAFVQWIVRTRWMNVTIANFHVLKCHMAVTLSLLLRIHVKGVLPSVNSTKFTTMHVTSATLLLHQCYEPLCALYLMSLDCELSLLPHFEPHWCFQIHHHGNCISIRSMSQY